MEDSPFTVAALFIAVVFLVYFLIRQNKKDRIKIEKELDYLKEIEEAEK